MFIHQIFKLLKFENNLNNSFITLNFQTNLFIQTHTRFPKFKNVHGQIQV